MYNIITFPALKYSTLIDVGNVLVCASVEGYGKCQVTCLIKEH